MSDTRVRVLTPVGTGAVATVEVAGPRAWELARQLFTPAGKSPLPTSPEAYQFWYGRLGDGDQVVLAARQVKPEPVVEVHCHGGRRVVRWVVEQLVAAGALEMPGVCTPGYALPAPSGGSGGSEPPEGATARSQGREPLDALSFAPTLRTASILLDQFHGAFDRAIKVVLADLDAGRVAPQLAELARLAAVGRHLVEPWRVVVAGPPNVGKSSLVNALAGYQRSVVSETAGTTRDVVTVGLAFDGWPVELADTAGLREAAGLEAEGIDRAERFIRSADLVLWVLDATAEHPQAQGADAPRSVAVVNKIDRPARWDPTRFPDAVRVSAVTGDGIPGLAALIARRLVPHPPEPGAAVPYTPELADAVEAAHAAGSPAAALLRAAVG